MAIAIILGILFAVLCIGGIIFAVYQHSENDNTKLTVVGVVVAVVMALLFITVPFSFRTVDTGEVAVVKHLG